MIWASAFLVCWISSAGFAGSSPEPPTPSDPPVPNAGAGETAQPAASEAPAPIVGTPVETAAVPLPAAAAPAAAADGFPAAPISPLSIVARPAEVGEAGVDLGGVFRPSAFRAEALIQMRLQETAVTIQPGLSALVMTESPSNVDRTVQLIRDTARENDGVRPRRILLDTLGSPTEGLRWWVRLDFARLLYEDAGQVVRWAYGEYAPMERLVLTAGIFDIPFTLWETMDEAEIELAERGPTHELLHHMRFAERDWGALLTMYPLAEKRWVQATAGAINGGADGSQSYRGPGLLAARVESVPSRHLQLGAGAVWRPRPLTAWWEELRYSYQAYDKGLAYSVDLTLSFWRAVLRAEWIAGDRTDNDVMVPLQQRRGDARTFRSTWAMVMLDLRLRSWRVLPALRAELLDTDREHPTGEILHLTAALNVYFNPRVRLLVDVSRHYAQIGTRNWEFTFTRYDTDATVAITQLQLRI